MSAGTSIEWTEATWNPIAGCTPISPGCLNCYAATMSARLESMGREKYRGLTVLYNGRRVFNGKITLDDKALSIPLERKKPTTYFVNSMSDLFHESVPMCFVAEVFSVMWSAQWHTFQVLTKRAERMQMMLNFEGFWQATAQAAWKRFNQESPEKAAIVTVAELWDDMRNGLENVWLGTSVENQKSARDRIPYLLKCRAKVRFLSCEPLLESINLDVSRTPDALADEVTEEDDAMGPPLGGVAGIDWVIVGGESGHHARPMHPRWAQSIRDQCQAAKVPFFFKQWGEWVDLQQSPKCDAERGQGHNPGFCHIDINGHPTEIANTNAVTVYKFGKKSAGRILDGRTWDEMPHGVRA